MGKISRSYKCYGIWEYEREEKELNEASQKGKQLVKGGCFHSVFEENKEVRYIYQLDYNTSIRDKERYREIFAEQGWEYINSTFNGWHYFRKVYEENMAEEESHIYTDRESLAEMQNRFLRICTVLGSIEAVLAVVYLFIGLLHGAPAILLEALVMGMIAVVFGLTVYDRRKKRAGEKGIKLISANIFFITIFALMILALILLFLY